MADQPMTRDDLVLLMESYKNMISMHQTILDQTSKTIDKMDNIATKQDSLFSKQEQSCNSLYNITNNISSTTKTIDKINDNLNEHDKKSIENNGKLVNKIHLGWIGMGTIIVGLITLVITLIGFIQHLPIQP